MFSLLNAWLWSIPTTVSYSSIFSDFDRKPKWANNLGEVAMNETCNSNILSYVHIIYGIHFAFATQNNILFFTDSAKCNLYWIISSVPNTKSIKVISHVDMAAKFHVTVCACWFVCCGKPSISLILHSRERGWSENVKYFGHRAEWLTDNSCWKRLLGNLKYKM